MAYEAGLYLLGAGTDSRSLASDGSIEMLDQMREAKSEPGSGPKVHQVPALGGEAQDPV